MSAVPVAEIFPREGSSALSVRNVQDFGTAVNYRLHLHSGDEPINSG